ncbi:MAG: hypothetical protein QOE14_1914, partial [Humisphaera sp.]|nr:hypothetical protein [Humisphaera sp.]
MLSRVSMRYGICLFCLVIGVSNLTARGDRAAEFKGTVQPLLQKFCYECHGEGNTAGELDLDHFKSSATVAAAKPKWQKMIRYARTQVMPPPEAELQPTQDERDQLVAALQRQLFDPSKPDPGRVTIRRLNRSEYKNT